MSKHLQDFQVEYIAQTMKDQSREIDQLKRALSRERQHTKSLRGQIEQQRRDFVAPPTAEMG